MDGVDIEDLTIEQYLELTQENNAPSVDLGADVNIMSRSALEELSLAEPKNTDMIVEMADKTRGGISNKKLKHYWKSTNDDDCIDLEWEGLSYTNWIKARYGKEDLEKCGETKTRAIIGEMVNKLPEEWFSGVSKDKDDLEGIIHYLEPTLYDGFIDLDDEAYKLRRNKLLGMPYSEPLLILKQRAKITRYNLRAGEVFTKTKMLNIKGVGNY
ncbi:hypothetical protein Tco_1434745 [Tanacetum coccineum]